jgi:hypothetical protein
VKGRRTAGFWLGIALSLTPGMVHADEGRREQCVQSYEAGQRVKKAGNLLEAASRLAFCANPSCPALMRQDCAARLEEVKAATPSLVLNIRFEGARAPVHVAIDGQGRAWAEDARQVIVNPGRHDLRVEAEGFKTQTVTFLIGEGEQSVPMEVHLAAKPTEKTPSPPTSATSTAIPATVPPVALPPAAPPPAAPPAHVAVAPPGPPTAAIWVGASSLIGTMGFVYFGLKARQRETQLEDQCAPMCTASQVNEVKQDYLLANVGLGLGVASLVASGVLFLVHSGKSTGEARGVEASVQLSPSSVGVTGRF